MILINNNLMILKIYVNIEEECNTTKCSNLKNLVTTFGSKM